MNVLLLLVLASASPADDFRKTQPSPLPSSTFTVPPVQTGVVPGTRLEIVLVEDHALPAVQLRMVFPSGSLLDPPEKAGLTGLCTRLANEGTERLTKVQWETALADLAASVELGVGAEQSSLSLRSLKETWPGTLDLALELVAHPGLRDDDLKRVRDRALAQLAQAKGSAAGLAARLQSRVAWGANHPMGALATEKSLAAIGVAVLLKESRVRADPAAPRPAFLGGVRDAVANPVVSRVLLVTLIYMGGFSGWESTFGFWTEARYGWTAREVGLCFVVVGIVSVICQGFLAGRLARRFGESRVLAFGCLTFGTSLIAQVFASRLLPDADWLVPAIMAVGASGMAMTMPNISALISRSVDPDRQGAMLGLNMASSSIARIFGPIIAGAIFSQIGHDWPLIIGAAMTIPAAVMAINAGRAFRKRQAAAVPATGQ